MANVFSNDPWAVEAWKMDSCTHIGGEHGILQNTWLAMNTTYDLVNFKEGVSSTIYDSNGDNMNCADGDLPVNFPFRTGDTRKIMTVCIWCRPTGLPAVGEWAWIVAKQHDWWWNYKNTWMLSIYNQAGQIRFHFYVYKGDGTTYHELTLGAAAPTLNHWYHLAASYNDNNGRMRFLAYDDTAGSMLDVQSSRENVTIPARIVDSKLNLGCCDFPWGGQFWGNLDELVVFARELNRKDIDRVRNGEYDDAGSGEYEELVGDIDRPGVRRQAWHLKGY